MSGISQVRDNRQNKSLFDTGAPVFGILFLIGGVGALILTLLL